MSSTRNIREQEEDEQHQVYQEQKDQEKHQVYQRTGAGGGERDMQHTVAGGSGAATNNDCRMTLIGQERMTV